MEQLFSSKLALLRLRTLAARMLRRERPDHTLQPTALVNECYLKLLGFRGSFRNEQHLLHIAARAMRQVLIDYSRTTGKKKRLTETSARMEEIVDAGCAAWFDPVQDIGVRRMWQDLSRFDPQAGQAVWLNCVEDVSVARIARIQGRTEWDVRKDCTFSLKWMKEYYSARHPGLHHDSVGR